MKITFISCLLFILAFSALGQKKITYTVTADAHALMCPFLSPKFMDLLTKKGAEGIYKDSTLAVHFTTTKEATLSDEYILKLVDEIGYDPRMFKIARKEE
jgi:hypothetical protein